MSNGGFNVALDSAERPATHVMVSLPCTRGTTWTYVHETLPGHAQLIDEKRKLFQEHPKRAGRICDVATQNGGWVTLELPRLNQYWMLPCVRDFVQKFKLELAYVYGCALGLADPAGNSIKKPWRFAINSHPIWRPLNGCFCPGTHHHTIAQGRVTKGTGKYPRGVALAIREGYTEALRATTKPPNGCRHLAAMATRSSPMATSMEATTSCFNKLSRWAPCP